MFCCDRERHENNVAASIGEVPCAEGSCRNRIESFVPRGFNNGCVSHAPVGINYEFKSGGQIVAPKRGRCKVIRYRHEELLTREYTRLPFVRIGCRRDANENNRSTQAYD
jgi:hypothetical protein